MEIYIPKHLAVYVHLDKFMQRYSNNGEAIIQQSQESRVYQSDRCQASLRSLYACISASSLRLGLLSLVLIIDEIDHDCTAEQRRLDAHVQVRRD